MDNNVEETVDNESGKCLHKTNSFYALEVII